MDGRRVYKKEPNVSCFSTTMKLLLIIFSLINLILARPEMRFRANPGDVPDGGIGRTAAYAAPVEAGIQFGPPPPMLDPYTPYTKKSVFVYTSPQEREYLQPSWPVLPPRPPQTHYKIVFIKTPTQATPPPPVIPAFSQDSEKTLIYVLVKRPEGPNTVVIPTPSPTKPSKPEVYFIRYKAQTETSVRDVVTPRPVYGVHK